MLASSRKTEVIPGCPRLFIIYIIGALAACKRARSQNVLASRRGKEESIECSPFAMMKLLPDAPGCVAAFIPRVAAFIQAGGDLREVGLHQPSQVAKIKRNPPF